MEDLPEAEQGEEVTEEMQAAAAEAGEVDEGKRVLEGDDLSQPEAVQAVIATVPQDPEAALAVLRSQNDQPAPQGPGTVEMGLALTSL
eukprot:5532386-Alexandrium_andersonii.AAC.1